MFSKILQVVSFVAAFIACAATAIVLGEFTVQFVSFVFRCPIQYVQPWGLEFVVVWAAVISYAIMLANASDRWRP